MNREALLAAGWRTIETRAFSGSIGTLWTRGEGSEITVGFVPGEAQSNEHLGTVHGGVLMTFADCALGVAVVNALGAPTCATAQLQIQFVAAGRTGTLITCRPEVIRKTSQLVFVRGLIVAEEKVIASVDGIWKVLQVR